MENSLRRKEEKRKLKREELAQRKKNELEKRSLEIKQLKKIKKQEIIERIKKIQEVTGNKGVGFEVLLNKNYNFCLSLYYCLKLFCRIQIWKKILIHPSMTKKCSNYLMKNFMIKWTVMKNQYLMKMKMSLL